MYNTRYHHKKNIHHDHPTQMDSRACTSRTYLWTPYKSVGCYRLTLRPM